MENSSFYETVIALSSAILGFVLSQSWEWYKRKRDEKENKEAAQSLIKLEIDRNIQLLKNYWKAVSNSKDNWYDKEENFSFSRLGYAINDVPFPKFSNEGWLSQLNTIGKIYDKKELEEVWKKYEAFNQLYEVKEHLLLLENESEIKRQEAQAQTGWASVGPLIKGIHFNQRAYSLAKIFKEITESLIGERTVQFENNEV